MYMLKIEHLKKHYDKFSLDCSLEVMSGCITGLIGQNGAGKSTTFKAVLGLISIDGGTVTILGWMKFEFLYSSLWMKSDSSAITDKAL